MILGWNVIVQICSLDDLRQVTERLWTLAASFESGDLVPAFKNWHVKCKAQCQGFRKVNVGWCDDEGHSAGPTSWCKCTHKTYIRKHRTQICAYLWTYNICTHTTSLGPVSCPKERWAAYLLSCYNLQSLMFSQLVKCCLKKFSNYRESEQHSARAAFLLNVFPIGIWLLIKH